MNGIWNNRAGKRSAEATMFPFRGSLNRKSLFAHLLVSFLIIIALLLSFNALTFYFFKNGIYDEVISHNRLILNKTTDNFEKHFALVSKQLVNFYFNDRINLLESEPRERQNPELVNQTSNELKSLVTNELLYLDNILLVFKSDNSVLDKNGISSANDLFAKYYASSDYPLLFWQDQFARNYHQKVFAASEFNKFYYELNRSPHAVLMPLIVKSQIDDRMYFVGLLDAVKLAEAFHYSEDSHFALLDEKGKPLYISAQDKGMLSLFPSFQDGEGYVQHNQWFYFYKKMPGTGITYIHSVPNKIVAEKIHRLTLVLGIILGVSVLASLTLSVALSVKFNNPFQRIIKAIEKPGSDFSLPSRIDEFQRIGDKIGSMMRTSQAAHADLTRKNSLLRQYGYLSKIKNIGNNFDDIRELIDTTEPVYFLLFQVGLTRRFYDSYEKSEHDRALGYTKEFIHAHISNHLPGSITLNLEHNQVASVVFKQKHFPAIMRTVADIKQVFDRDTGYFFLTVALNTDTKAFSELDAAYMQASELIRRRKLNEETQIIVDRHNEPDSPAQIYWKEKELWENLKHGNEANLIRMVKRTLDRMEKRNENAYRYREFAEGVVGETIKAIVECGEDIEHMLEPPTPYELISYCNTSEQYEQVLESFLSKAARLIVHKRDAKDPIADFVTDYIRNHYDEDLSLEGVADKLNLSAGYLSIYFKEKKGVAFSDYLNEIRLVKAKELLLETECSIQDVATRVGYQNVNSFIRMFKRSIGMPPGQYRKLNFDNAEAKGDPTGEAFASSLDE